MTAAMAKSDKQQEPDGETRRRRPLRGDLVRIGRKLGQRYDPVAEEPLPDRFAELLERLDRRERGSRRRD